MPVTEILRPDTLTVLGAAFRRVASCKYVIQNPPPAQGLEHMSPSVKGPECIKLFCYCCFIML